MSGNILDFINGISSDDFVSAKASFDSMMASKMQDAFDSQRIQVASQFYNDVPPTEVDSEDAVESEE